MSEESSRAQRRTPGIALNEQLGQMEIGEEALFGALGSEARQAMKHREHVARVDRTRERPFDLTAQLLRLLGAGFHPLFRV